MGRKKNRQPPPPPPPVSSPKDCCKYCQKYHLKLSKCSRCKEAFYCSSECQGKDWVNHKKDCKPPKSEQQSPDPLPTPLPDKNESCSNCGKSGVKLRKCSRCQEAKYCSIECQKAEWPKHKVDCKKHLSSGASKAEMPEHKANRAKDFFSAFKVHYEKDFMPGAFQKFEDRFCADDPEYLKVPNNVYRIARKRYPGYQLITNFFNIDITKRSKQVLLVLMYTIGNHLFRPSMVLRDNKELLLLLIFYLQDDDRPDPEKFKVGNYMCITYPELHLFKDGQTGFRIDFTSLVSFIEK